MYQPYPPPQRPTLRQRFSRLPLIGKLGVGCLGLLLVVCCISGIGLAAYANKTPTPASSGQIATATPTATPRPTPTLTPTPSGPHILVDAVLGGLEDAFQAKYGAPSGTGTAKTYSFTINGQAGLVTATPLSAASSDGKDHVASLRIGPSSGDWSAATAQPICAMFLPPDAKFVKVKQVAGYGPERVYISADLALSFDKGEFSDSDTGKAVTPGTFSMELWPGKAFNHGCILILGT